MTWISKYELNKKTKAIINATQMKKKQKKLTDKGKERKGRIVTKLFYEKLTRLLNSDLFMSVLPLFKSFILAFEQKEWLIHWLHRSLVEVINNMPYKKLNFINVASNVQKLKTLYVRDEREKLVLLLRKNKIQGDIATDFYRKLCTAYVITAVYIRKKYTLNNPRLEFFCALIYGYDNHFWHIKTFLNLKPYFETFLWSGCGENPFEMQKYITDSEFLLPEEKVRLDVWWNKVFKTNRYPVLSSLVRSCLSIFTGPMLKCPFTMMNDIIDSRSGHLEIETCSAIMTAKYSL